MTLHNAVVAAVVLSTFAFFSRAGFAPASALAQDQNRGPESRAELYRRHLLAASDVPCRTNASCAALGVAALKAGKVKQAQSLVAMESALADATAMQAGEEGSPKATSSARARVAMALVHQGDVQQKLGAFTNARAFYRTAVSRGDAYPGDTLLARVVAAARERLDAIPVKSVATDMPAGVPAARARFTQYRFLGAWNTIGLNPVKGRPGVYRMDGEFVYPTVDPDGEPSANLGSLSAYVRFYDGVARVLVPDDVGRAPIDATAKITHLAPYDGHDDRCLIELRLAAPETLDVSTHGSPMRCGFGANVTADGRYYLMTGS